MLRHYAEGVVVFSVEPLVDVVGNVGRRAVKRPLGTEARNAIVVRRCKLDPGLKAACFQPLNLRVHTVLLT